LVRFGRTPEWTFDDHDRRRMRVAVRGGQSDAIAATSAVPGETPVTLALPTKTRSVRAPTRRTEQPAVELTARMSKSRLDLVLDGLHGAHRRHASGPIFPCPLCFDPPLQSAR